MITKGKETATVTLDELKSEPSKLFTEFMKNLIMEEVGCKSKKPTVHFKDDVKASFD